MTSTNDGKDVKSNQISGPKGKSYYIELYKSLDGRLSASCESSERSRDVCEAWRALHTLCAHSTPSTHEHYVRWIQRHTAKTILQTQWQQADREDDRTKLISAIDAFTSECDASEVWWQSELCARGRWFKQVLHKPWDQPVLSALLNASDTPSDDEVLKWLKEEQGITFVMRLQTLAAEKCEDIALSLAAAVMERARQGLVVLTDEEQTDERKDKPKPEISTSPFGAKLSSEAGFTSDIWNILVDIEFVLLHKRDNSKCIELAKKIPLREAYSLVERLLTRLEASPREKRLWKHAKDVAVLIAHVVVGRCMVVGVCVGWRRAVLFGCARALARGSGARAHRLAPTLAALTAPAPTANHLHTVAHALDVHYREVKDKSMAPFVCELYVRALTAGMNELEKLKLNTEKDKEARCLEQLLSTWFMQLGAVLSSSDRMRCECALTAFSIHPSAEMYGKIKAAPVLTPMPVDIEPKLESTSEFGSWAGDSHTQTNFVKTSETLNMKQSQHQANVLSTAIFNEGEALGLNPDLCQDIAVVLSGPRVKTLSWDMDREQLLENCRTYMERTHGGTKALTTELKYLNLDLNQYKHLPEEQDDEDDLYYGIEKGYEHLVPQPEPEDDLDDQERTESALSLYEVEINKIASRPKKQTKRVIDSSDEADTDPLSQLADSKREEKKERPHSKERSKERKERSIERKKSSIERKERSKDRRRKEKRDPLSIDPVPDKPKKDKKEKKKKDKPPKTSLSNLVGVKIVNNMKMASVSDSDYDSQGKSSLASINSEGDVIFDGLFCMDEIKSPPKTDTREMMKNNEFCETIGEIKMYEDVQKQVAKSREEIKKSLSKFIDERRNKNLEMKKLEDNKKQIKIQNAIIDPEIPLQGNIIPTAVAIPEIPKSYINKQQSQKLDELKREYDNIVTQRKMLGLSTPTSNVIQYAHKNFDKSYKQQNSIKMKDLATVPQDRLPPKISMHDYNTSTSNQYHCYKANKSIQDTSEQRDFKKFLAESCKSPYPMTSKKEIKPVSRVTPVMVNPVVKPESKPQRAKPTHKHPDSSLNTFSRLSYMHKNKQNDLRNKPVQEHSKIQTIGSKIDGFILDHLNHTNKTLDSQIMNLNRQIIEQKIINQHEIKQNPESYNPSSTSNHTLLANMLQNPPSLMTKCTKQTVPSAVSQTSPQKTSLSEKDQNDLLLLLRQQNKMNISFTRQNVIIPPSNRPVNVASSPVDRNTNASATYNLPSTSAQVNTSTKKPLNDGKIINIISNSIIKPANTVTSNVDTPLNVSKKIRTNHEQNKKSQVKEQKKPVPKKTEQPDWESVFNKLSAQKTPKRGPNALEMALNNIPLEVAYQTNTNNYNIKKPETAPKHDNLSYSEDHSKSSTSMHTKVDSNSHSSISKRRSESKDKKTSKLDISKNVMKKVKSCEVPPKYPVIQKKPLNYEGPKDDDPFISGIPNSDYDLIEELMDDDLRKEIGELSSDEDNYGNAASNFLKDNKTGGKRDIIYNKPLEEMAASTTKLPTKNTNFQCTKNTQPHCKQIDQKLCSNANMNEHYLQKSSHVTNSGPCLNASKVIISTPKPQCSKNTVINSTFGRNQITIDPSIYLNNVPQSTPIQNVVHIGTDLVYSRYPSVQTQINNINQPYLAVNNPSNMTLYQTTQFAAPVINPIIIGNAVTIPVINPLSVQTTNLITNDCQNNSAYLVEPCQNRTNVLSTNEIQHHNNNLVNKQTAANNCQVLPNTCEVSEQIKWNETIQSTINNVQKTKQETLIPTDKDHSTRHVQFKSDLIQSSLDMINVNKSSERKVLSQVQEKFPLTEPSEQKGKYIKVEKEITSNIHNTDKERVRKKRLAIINRKISYYSENKAIPLTYSPIRPIENTETDMQPKNNSTEAIEFSSKSQQSVQVNSEKESTLTVSESTKENNNEKTTCRRILLRSSNRIKTGLSDDVAAKASVNSEKVKDSQNAGKELQSEDKTKNSDMSTVNTTKRNIISAPNVKLDKKSRGEKSRPSTKVARKVNVVKHKKKVTQNFNKSDFLGDFDIEMELTGVKILKSFSTQDNIVNAPDNDKETNGFTSILCDENLQNSSNEDESDMKFVSDNEIKSHKVSNDFTNTGTSLSEPIINQSNKKETPLLHFDDSNNILSEMKSELENDNAVKIIDNDDENSSPEIISEVTPEFLPEIVSKVKEDRQICDLLDNSVSEVIRKDIEVASILSQSIINESQSSKEDTIKNIEIISKAPVIPDDDECILINDDPIKIISSDTKYADDKFQIKPEVLENNSVKSNVFEEQCPKVVDNNEDEPILDSDYIEIIGDSSANKNPNQQENESSEDICVSDVPQSYKDSIKIEHLPNTDNNPLQTSVRVRLPTGRVFKATVYGDICVNFDTLFEQPAIKSVLINNMNINKKKYTLNIKQVTKITHKNSGLTKNNNTMVQEDKPITKLETVNLVSDEEDESQQKLITQYGKYKIKPIEEKFLRLHQQKLYKKCSVSLEKINLSKFYVKNETNAIQDTKSHINLFCNESLDDVFLKNDLCKTKSNKTGVSDDLNAKSKMKAVQSNITDLRNKLIQDIVVKKKIDAKESLNILKGNLSQDVESSMPFSVIRPNKSVRQPKHTKKSVTTKHKNSTCKKSDSECLKISECFVKLIRCDDIVKTVTSSALISEKIIDLDKHESISLDNSDLFCVDEPILIESDESDDVDIIVSTPLTNSISLLDNSPEKQNSGRSSPVIEIFDFLAAIESQRLLQNNGKLHSYITLNCDADLFETKCQIHLLAKTKEHIKESEKHSNVSKLMKIALETLQKQNLIDKLVEDRNRAMNTLKRKAITINKISSPKILKSNDENDECQPDLDRTSFSIMTDTLEDIVLTEEKLNMDSSSLFSSVDEVQCCFIDDKTSNKSNTDVIDMCTSPSILENDYLTHDCDLRVESSSRDNCDLRESKNYVLESQQTELQKYEGKDKTPESVYDRNVENKTDSIADNNDIEVVTSSELSITSLKVTNNKKLEKTNNEINNIIEKYNIDNECAMEALDTLEKSSNNNSGSIINSELNHSSNKLKFNENVEEIIPKIVEKIVQNVKTPTAYSSALENNVYSLDQSIKELTSETDPVNSCEVNKNDVILKYMNAPQNKVLGLIKDENSKIILFDNPSTTSSEEEAFESVYNNSSNECLDEKIGHLLSANLNKTDLEVKNEKQSYGNEIDGDENFMSVPTVNLRANIEIEKDSVIDSTLDLNPKHIIRIPDHEYEIDEIDRINIEFNKDYETTDIPINAIILRDKTPELIVETITEMLSEEIVGDFTIQSEELDVGSQKAENFESSSKHISVIIADKSKNITSTATTKYVKVTGGENQDMVLKGIEYEDPDVGNCNVFPLLHKSDTQRSMDLQDKNQVPKLLKEGKFSRVQEDLDCQHLIVVKPKHTYSKSYRRYRNLKRKKDMSDLKVHVKKYRKGKNIDYTKFTVAALTETTYSKEFKRLFDYCSSVKFSYSRPFHKENIEVSELIKCWPIQDFSVNTNVAIITAIPDNQLFKDEDENRSITDPLNQTLAQELVSEYDENSYKSIEINETNFNMGFGEGSGRVIHNSKSRYDPKLSAATLSDVKHYQPLLLSETQFYKKDLHSNMAQHIKYNLIKEIVRSFFEQTSSEFNFTRSKKQENLENNLQKFPYGLTSPDFLEVPVNEVIVNVVQVGQLAVSAAAQNPVTCDPRVTHVSNVSPSQCSAENSPDDDSDNAMKTEYTELTTADITLPLVQEYAQHHQQMSIENQDSNASVTDEINSGMKLELSEETSRDRREIEDVQGNYENTQISTIAGDTDRYTYNQNMSNVNMQSEGNSHFPNIVNADEQKSETYSGHENEVYSEHRSAHDSYNEQQDNAPVEKTDQIAHAMNAAGISPSTDNVNTTNADALVDIISQNAQSDVVTTSHISSNNYSKSTPINAMALQQALAQILPPPLNQTSMSENGQSTNPPVLHIVQGGNTQTVLNKQNGTPLLHIVQNKSATNGTPSSQANTFSGLSLVDTGLQQGGNQLLHIVNTNQKNNNTGQLLKRVNLLTNLANVQGSNEQKMVQFVCKSADGKSIQLNAPHQRSMVLRLQPIDPSTIQHAPKPSEQDNSAANANNVNGKDSQQEIKSRSVYEENYAKFIQNGSTKSDQEKSTSLPKFNQVFGKQVYQDNKTEMTGESLPENAECAQGDNNVHLEQINEINSPPLLIRKSPAQTSQAQSNIVQQIKQTIAPMNIQTMHGGVIYTRQIPVNIGGGQTINLITVPSTEIVDESGQKQQTETKFNNQEGDSQVIKIVQQNQNANSSASSEDNNAQIGATSESSHNPQPQPVLTQMRIKLPMLSKAPQMVSAARVVRPSFFQIQRNVIGGTNQPVYQQLVLTTAPPLGQSIRVPAQTQPARTTKPPESQSSPESQMSSSTLEQLREFDMVLEQVKERSTVQPGSSNSNSFSSMHSSADATDSAAAPTTSTSETTQQSLFTTGTSQSLNMTSFVNRKSTVTSATPSSFVRSPDSSGIVESTSSSTHIPHTVTSETPATETPAQQPKPKKKKPKSSSSSSSSMKINTTPPKTSSQKPLEDEQTTQRILYILAEYKEQVENSPDKDKPAPRRRNNLPPGTGSKRKKSSSGSRRRDMSPILGEDSCRTMGSEDSSCGTSLGECAECMESHSPQESPRKVVRKLTFEQETATTQTRTIPQRNVIVADGQTITVARNATGKPATTVLMPANYLLPVSMVKGGQQIAIVTNRGPKLLVGGGEGGTGGTLLFQRLIGPAGLKPMLARPGVRHIRLPSTALHNLQAFNIATPATTVQPPDSTASPAPAPTPPDLVDTRAMSSPWPDRESQDTKPERGGSSPEGSEPWNLPSSSIADDYGYEEIVRTDNMDRTVLDAIPDRYSPDMEAQRIFDKMFDVDTKKSMYDTSRCGYDIDASDSDDRPYHQVVQRKDGRHHRLTHVSAAALRHKYAILEHELRLQKSLSEECEDLGVDSPSASELFPEAELLFAPSPAHEQTIDPCHTPQPTVLNQGISQLDIDDQMATDHLLTHNENERQDLDINLDDVGEIVTVGEDGMATIPLDHEEFARSHPNTTFHTEPEDGEMSPFTIAQGIKGRQITFHASRGPGTVVMAPQTTVISQATVEASGTQNTVKFTDIDNMINSIPNQQTNVNMPSVLVKDDSLNKFDNILNESREIHANTASAIVHSSGQGTQVIRRVRYDDRREPRYLVDDPSDGLMEDKIDDNRDLESMRDDASSPERHPELFWESNSASERSEGRRRLDFSSDSDKCCKSPFDEASTDSSVGAHTRLDSVIKAARTERSGSDGSSDDHPPLRTYPPKRIHHHPHHHEMEQSLSGKTRAGERCLDVEGRRRASNRGVVKRGCHCCNGSPAPPKPKKSRQKKDFTNTN